MATTDLALRPKSLTFGAMNLYAAIGRPLFLSLPPEAAHRFANRLLGLPLPWARIGDASDDQRLAVTLAGVPLRNPLGLAAGFDKTCAHLDALGALGFGYVVGGTITRAPRAGNPKPRIARYPKRRSMVNAMGLPNPGAEVAARNLARTSGGPAPRFVSLADEAVDDAVASLDLLSPLVEGVELNASCPNVSWGRDRDNESHLRELVTAFVERTPKPVFVKLPPFTTETERSVVLALARIVHEAGAAGLTCSNTRLVADRRVAVGEGGLSGRALWPRTPDIVAEVREATGGDLPVNASGGVFTAADALACLEAGAATVQVYTGLIYEGPGIVGTITSRLAASLPAGTPVLPPA
ncbi:MAG: dihydroorotate dehydrogenase 2 [Actinomycetota bacterium]|nr:dihydroorotate dehydrogenase 2 [Actinomycetota bacterium]